MLRRFAAAAVAAFVSIGLAAAPPRSLAQVAHGGGLVRLWDARTMSDGQFVAYNSDPLGAQYGMPVASGNLDGADDDGVVRDDVVLAPFYAEVDEARPAAGKLHVYFGRTPIAGVVEDPRNGTPPRSVEILGARAGDFLGNEVDVADVTGDGLDDIIACAQGADGFGTSSARPQAGACYVIVGRSEWPAEIDLADGPQAGVIELLGARETTDSTGRLPGDRFGFWASAGDVTGDGVDDLLVSADLGDGPTDAKSNAGELYVIPGGANLREAAGAAGRQIDVKNPGATKVFTIYGVDANDHFGSSIAAADFDGDGVEDIACSAGVSRSGATLTVPGQGGAPGSGGGDGASNALEDAGEVHVIYGRSLAVWMQTPSIQLTAAPGPDHSIYYGEDVRGYFGEDVSTGDFDGDGRPELLVGALLASAPVQTGVMPMRLGSGIGYIFWGASLARNESLDLAALPLTTPRVTRVFGEFVNDLGADSVRIADVNADGRGDLLFGSPNNNGSGAGGASRATAGDLKVVFGMAAKLPPVVDTAAMPFGVMAYQIVAPDLGDMFTYSLTTGDFDGDGYADLMPNAMGGDGLNNQYSNAGELYVISGRRFSELAGQLSETPPALQSFRVSPAGGPYYAGQGGIVLTLTGSNFQPGATVRAGGVDVPASAVEYVSATEIRVRLDAAPAVLNTPGALELRVVNPDGGASAALETITLLGPEIASVKAKRAGANVTITVDGANFREGATVLIETADGTPVATLSVKRKKPTRLKVKVAGSAVAAGASLTIRVVNPGPVASAPASVTVR